MRRTRHWRGSDGRDVGLGAGAGPGERQGGVEQVPRLSSGRRERQEPGRPGPQRADRPQGRHRRGLRLLGGQQEFGDRLGRRDVPRVHQEPEGKDPQHQDGVRRPERPAGHRGPPRLPQAVRPRRQEEVRRVPPPALLARGRRWRSAGRGRPQ